MPKVYGIHLLALHPGVQAAEFERYIAEEIYSFPLPEGVQFSLLKGDRGDRAGRYLALFEFDSVERRNWVSSEAGQLSPAYQQAIAAAIPPLEKWADFASGPVDPTFTDYVVVGK